MKHNVDGANASILILIGKSRLLLELIAESYLLKKSGDLARLGIRNFFLWIAQNHFRRVAIGSKKFYPPSRKFYLFNKTMHLETFDSQPWQM